MPTKINVVEILTGIILHIAKIPLIINEYILINLLIEEKVL
jgi:hypothetical protein